MMSACCLLPVLQLFQHVGGHTLPLPQVGGHTLPLPQVGGHTLPLPQVGGHTLTLPQVGGHTLPLPEVGGKIGHKLPLTQALGGGHQDRKGQEHVDKTGLIPVLGGRVNTPL